MTTIADIKAVTPTGNAKSVLQTKGASVDALMQHAQMKAAELKVLVNQIISLHPGGDANLTALNNILSALA